MMRRSQTGQMMILATMIALVLLLAIPIMVYLNQTSGRHQVSQQKTNRAQGIAEEGLAYAIRSMSDNTIWTDALTGDFDAIPECAGGDVDSVQGGRFRLQCTNTADATTFKDLQPYQIGIKSTAYLPGPNGAMQPMRAMVAFVSKRTLGASLNTGLSASAALQLVNPPVTTEFQPITVHWGPVVLFSKLNWLLTGSLDFSNNGGENFIGHPRKFSNGRITGSFSNRTLDETQSALYTDNREFWSSATMNFPPLINLVSYETDAKHISNAGRFTGTPDCSGCTQINGFFDVPVNSTATFGGGGSTFALSGSGQNAVIYIKGNARFIDIGYDMRNGAFIVEGDLLMENAGGGIASFSPSLRVSTSAWREYAYWPNSGPAWPCRANIGSTCSIASATNSQTIHYRGFLYVKGNLVVSGGTNSHWRLAGAVSVGDFLTNSGTLYVITNGAKLTVFYDDVINKSIKTLNTELQVDHLKSVSAI